MDNVFQCMNKYISSGNFLLYCLQLDKIQITFDGGMTTMNFSQAAFVIQKSACVYSKKVRLSFKQFSRQII